jgi:hypothetical protein
VFHAQPLQHTLDVTCSSMTAKHMPAMCCAFLQLLSTPPPWTSTQQVSRGRVAILPCALLTPQLGPDLTSLSAAPVLFTFATWS